MKRTLGVLMAIIATFAAVFALTGCAADTSGIQSDIDRLTGAVTDLTDKVNDLTSENKTLADKVNDLKTDVSDLNAENDTLKDRVNDLTTENGALKDRVEGLNVFTTDKAEYDEHETMTVYFNNKPVLKIRLGFDDSIYKVPLDWAGDSTLNSSIYLTSLCIDMYVESIIGMSYIVWENGAFMRRQKLNSSIAYRNIEGCFVGQYDGLKDAYTNATWFDLVICVPGTPFELARFKNVSVYRPQ